jgi:hypothetical protein
MLTLTSVICKHWWTEEPFFLNKIIYKKRHEGWRSGSSSKSACLARWGLDFKPSIAINRQKKTWKWSLWTALGEAGA